MKRHNGHDVAEVADSVPRPVRDAKLFNAACDRFLLDNGAATDAWGKPRPRVVTIKRNELSRFKKP